LGLPLLPLPAGGSRDHGWTRIVVVEIFLVPGAWGVGEFVLVDCNGLEPVGSGGTGACLSPSCLDSLLLCDFLPATTATLLLRRNFWSVLRVGAGKLEGGLPVWNLEGFEFLPGGGIGLGLALLTKWGLALPFPFGSEDGNNITFFPGNLGFWMFGDVTFQMLQPIVPLELNVNQGSMVLLVLGTNEVAFEGRVEVREEKVLHEPLLFPGGVETKENARTMKTITDKTQNFVGIQTDVWGSNGKAGVVRVVAKTGKDSNMSFIFVRGRSFGGRVVMDPGKPVVFLGL
jgi:hypothetical protein